MRYVIGLDIGTTGTKALLIEENGDVAGEGYKEYDLLSPAPGIFEQDAEDWWDAAKYAVRKATEGIDKKEVAAIGLSTQGASCLAVDENFKPLCRVISWMDSRAKEEADIIAEKLGGESVYKKSGWRVSPTLDAEKVLWMKRNNKDVFKKAASFVSTIEYINFKLTGENVIDPTNAAIRQMLDIRTGKWDKEILDVIGIDEKRLPTVEKTGEKVGNLTAKAADELGLTSDVVVYNGAHDQYCASLGSGATEIGDMLLATGTTWVTLGITSEPLYTESFIAPGIHPAGGYGAMASLVSAGSALKWYKNIIDGDFKTIDKEVEKRKDSAKTLLFYPYLAGAGFPHNSPEGKAEIKGLEMRHDKYDIARALMEGVCFEAKAALDEFDKHNMPVKRLMMTGGAAKSNVWSAMVGYISGCEIWRTSQSENCCIGAALIAGVNCGIFGSYKEGCGLISQPVKLETPDEDMYGYYKEKLELYRQNGRYYK